MRGEPYLIILQDKAETSNSRFEGRKHICRVSHSTENQFGGGGYSGFPVLSAITHGVLLLFATIRIDGVICAALAKVIVREGNTNLQGLHTAGFSNAVISTPAVLYDRDVGLWLQI